MREFIDKYHEQIAASLVCGFILVVAIAAIIKFN